MAVVMARNRRIGRRIWNRRVRNGQMWDRLVLRHWLTRVACALAVAGLLLGGPGTGTGQAVGGPAALRDPFASRPLGPFSLLTNPATVVDETSLRLHVGFQPDESRGFSRFIAVSEPGAGLGAGALMWLDGIDRPGEPRWRQISYTVGQFLTDRMAVGLSIKHFKSSRDQRWAGDLGLYVPVERGLQVGLVYYNVFGPAPDDPRELAASISFIGQQGWAVSAEVAGLSSSARADSVIAWALDVPLGPRGLLRAGHRGPTGGDGPTEWLGSLRWQFGRFGLDAGVVVPDRGTARYRFGLQLAF